jgi:hypothetical protein
MIDQDLSFFSYPILGGTIIELILYDRYEAPVTICGGVNGYFSLLLNFRNQLTFAVQDYI